MTNTMTTRQMRRAAEDMIESRACEVCEPKGGLPLARLYSYPDGIPPEVTDRPAPSTTNRCPACGRPWRPPLARAYGGFNVDDV